MDNAYNSYLLDVAHPDGSSHVPVNGLHHFSIICSVREGEYYALAPNTEVFASVSLRNTPSRKSMTSIHLIYSSLLLSTWVLKCWRQNLADRL